MTPDGWKITKLEDVASINPKRKTDIQDDLPVSFVGMADVSESARLVSSQTKEYREVSKGFTSFEDGDILVAKITPCFENGKGALVSGLTNGIGFGSTEFHVIRAGAESDNKFLFYHTVESEFRRIGEANMTGSAGQRRVPTDYLKDYIFPLPPLPEQRKIAAILSSVDDAIQATQKVIDQTERVKRGLLQELLTRGIGHTEFKQTEIGEIPRNWKVDKIGNLLEERSERSSNTDQYPLYSLTIENGITAKTERYERGFLLKDKDNNEFKIVHDGDIVFNPMNLRFGAIAMSRVSKTVTVSAYYNVLKATVNSVNKSYLAALLGSRKMIKYYDDIAIGSLIEKRRVHLSMFKDIKIALPPIEEQNSIQLTIDSVLNTISENRTHLESLRILKQGLMQDLLTGKVRV